jgi:hypothetical protein
MFLRNISLYMSHTTLHPRRRRSSLFHMVSYQRAKASELHDYIFYSCMKRFGSKAHQFLFLGLGSLVLLEPWPSLYLMPILLCSLPFAYICMLIFLRNLSTFSSHLTFGLPNFLLPPDP